MRWLTLGVLVTVIVTCTACGGPTADKARDFEAYGTWWLGDEFEGLELSSADESLFLYGTCQTTHDGGCAAPAQVILQENCSFAALDFEHEGSEEAIRGGATFLSVRDGQALVRTGTTAITLFGRDDDMTRRMADGLESLNLAPNIDPGEPMPPPIICP